MNIVFIVLFCFASGGIIIADYNDNFKMRLLFKPLLMPFLLLFYYFSVQNPNYLIVGALVLGFVGDIAMIRSGNKSFFIVGVGAFLIGHVLYIIVLAQSLTSFDTIKQHLLFLIIYLSLGVYIYFKLRPHLLDMKIPVLIYILVILFMGFLCFARICCFSGAAFWLPFIGSMFFILSDFIIAFNEFKRKIPKAEVYFMTTYILAQLFIILGLME